MVVFRISARSSLYIQEQWYVTEVAYEGWRGGRGEGEGEVGGGEGEGEVGGGEWVVDNPHAFGRWDFRHPILPYVVIPPMHT